MHLKQLSLLSFRNLEDGMLAFEPHFNVIMGRNGQGKTNLLEAIYWLSSLRPARTSRLKELVRFGENAMRVEGMVEAEGLTHRLAIGVEKGERLLQREGKACSMREYFGVLSAILFMPDDVSLIGGPPEQRRRFLDRAIFNGNPGHLNEVLAYRRALEGRNRLLREASSDLLLEAFEESLAQAAARLNLLRALYLEDFSKAFSRIFFEISGGSKAHLSYRCAVASSEIGDPKAFMNLWQADRVHDRQRGFTSRGPHGDDLEIHLESRSARAYASQGQRRSMALALKIAEIELLQSQHHMLPILLLDDVSSELDADKNAQLFSFLERYQGQVFITTTDVRYLQIEAEKTIWQVEAGAIQPL